jgi:1-acyl-sn-glycerol-3-phosphate acyltransferase
MGEFKPGVGMILAGSSIPVVPVRVTGSFLRHPKGSFFPKPGKIIMHIGQAVTYHGLSSGRESAEIITRDLRCKVGGL